MNSMPEHSDRALWPSLRRRRSIVQAWECSYCPPMYGARGEEELLSPLPPQAGTTTDARTNAHEFTRRIPCMAAAFPGDDEQCLCPVDSLLLSRMEARTSGAGVLRSSYMSFGLDGHHL